MSILVRFIGDDRTQSEADRLRWEGDRAAKGEERNKAGVVSSGTGHGARVSPP